MAELDDNSIDCALTSPPYWGLRDYGDDVKEIWGGDRDCEHAWKSVIKHRTAGGPQVPQSKWKDNKAVANGQRDKKSEFCRNCNAWRGQLGLEPTFQLYLDHMMIVCTEIKRVLKKTGSLWLNIGDTYGGSWQNFGSRKGGQRPKSTQTFERKDNPQFYPPTARIMQKCLIGIPWRLVLRLVDEQGWILRNAIIWAKPNHMPSSVKDRCSNGYEFLFHLVKQKKYYYDLDAIRKPYTEPLNRWGGPKTKLTDRSKGDEFAIQQRIGREYRPNSSGKNPGDVWTIPTQPRPDAHFATFPDRLCTRPILATCPKGGILLDPFAGRGTALIMAKKLGRHYVGYELKKEYVERLIRPALEDIDPLFSKLG